MTWPTIVVEAELDPVGDPDTWTDITADVLSLTVDRGRPGDLDRFRAGRLVLQLQNYDRAYDPAEHPEWAPNKRVRVFTDPWYLFTGYVDSIRQDYTGPHTARATLQATDMFKVLNRALLPSSAYIAEVEADGPDHLYRLDEAGGATTIYDSVGDRDLAVAGTWVQAPSLVARDNNPAATLADQGDGAGSSATAVPANRTALTVELIYQTTDSGAGQTAAGEVTGTVDRGWAMEIDTGVFDVTVVTSSGNASLSSATNVDDGEPHHLALRWTGTNVYLYVDGVQKATAALAGTMFDTSHNTYLVVGGATSGPFSNTGAAGTYDELAVWYSDIGAARIAAHAEQVNTPWDGDTPAERIDRILDIVGIPAGDRDLDTGTSVLQPATLGQTALEHIQKVAESDFGAVFVAGDGKLTFLGRTSLINQSSAGTFTDAHGGTPALSFLAPEISDADLRNDVIVSRLDGKAQRAEDPASIAAHGRVTWTRDGLYHDSDLVSLDAANFILAEQADPENQIREVLIRPAGDHDLFPFLQALDLTNLVHIGHRPQGTGGTIDQAAVVDGITHTLGPKAWDTRLQLSPAAGAGPDTGYWELGVAGRGELGQTTRLFF